MLLSVFAEIDNLGTLSAKFVVTNVDGQASVDFTPDADTENIYGIVATHGEDSIVFILLAIDQATDLPNEPPEVVDVDFDVFLRSNSDQALYIYPNNLSLPLRLQATNIYMQPISGIRVNFWTDSQTILFTSETGVSDDTGHLDIRFRATRPGTYIIYGRLDSTPTDSADIEFVVYVLTQPAPRTSPPAPRTSPPTLRTSNIPLSGGYIVWLEENDQGCQSGVIHSDYVYIDRENKSITFTGADGEVDPGDTVRAYIKVETGYTYEQASERAPEILEECPF